MNKKEYIIHNFTEIRKLLNKVIKRKDINISKLAKDTDIPRNSIYSILNNDYLLFERLQAIFDELGLVLSIKATN